MRELESRLLGADVGAAPVLEFEFTFDLEHKGDVVELHDVAHIVSAEYGYKSLTEWLPELEAKLFGNKWLSRVPLKDREKIAVFGAQMRQSYYNVSLLCAESALALCL